MNGKAAVSLVARAISLLFVVYWANRVGKSLENSIEEEKQRKQELERQKEIEIEAKRRALLDENLEALIESKIRRYNKHRGGKVV